MENKDIIIGTTCSSYDPNTIQCDKQAELPIHQLNKYCEENDTRYDIHPISVIQAIFDGRTGTRLDRILAMCNSIYITWEGTFADTVNKLDKVYRRKGYIITYRDETDVNWTQRYKSDDISDEAWANPDNWEGWSFDTAVSDLSEAIENIFVDINNYPEFKGVINTAISNFIQEVFNNLNSYPELVEVIKNSTLEELPDVLKQIFADINNYPELKEVFNNYVKQWTENIFNNIDSYPELSNFITNAINSRVETTIENIFNNIDNYPKIKDILINTTKEQVLNIFKNIEQYPELKNAIQEYINDRVTYIFNNLEEFPDLVSLLQDLVCVCVQNIFININNYPSLIACINTATNQRVDYIFNNIDRFPILKNLIETKVIGRVEYIFNNINDFEQLLAAIKGDVEYIFNNVNNYPALKTVVESKTAETVEVVLSNIDDYPGVGDKIKEFVEECINTKRGAANGIASLDENGFVPSNQLPSYVDDVLEGIYESETLFKKTEITTREVVTLADEPVYYEPERGKIYVDVSEGTDHSGKTYRWSGSMYVLISDSVVIGEIAGTAFDGERGKQLEAKFNRLPKKIAAGDTNSKILESFAHDDHILFRLWYIQKTYKDGPYDHYYSNEINIPIVDNNTDNKCGFMSKARLDDLNNLMERSTRKYYEISLDGITKSTCDTLEELIYLRQFADVGIIHNGKQSTYALIGGTVSASLDSTRSQINALFIGPYMDHPGLNDTNLLNRGEILRLKIERTADDTSHTYTIGVINENLHAGDGVEFRDDGTVSVKLGDGLKIKNGAIAVQSDADKPSVTKSMDLTNSMDDLDSIIADYNSGKICYINSISYKYYEYMGNSQGLPIIVSSGYFNYNGAKIHNIINTLVDGNNYTYIYLIKGETEYLFSVSHHHDACSNIRIGGPIDFDLYIDFTAKYTSNNIIQDNVFTDFLKKFAFANGCVDFNNIPKTIAYLNGKSLMQYNNYSHKYEYFNGVLETAVDNYNNNMTTIMFKYLFDNGSIYMDKFTKNEDTTWSFDRTILQF